MGIDLVHNMKIYNMHPNKRLAMQRKAPQRIRKYPSHLNKHRPAKGGKFKQKMNTMMSKTLIDWNPGGEYN